MPNLWDIGYLLNNAYLLEQITKLSEIREFGGANSCVVKKCHSSTHPNVRTLDYFHEKLLYPQRGGLVRGNTDLSFFK